jgi:hypothetical protein
MVFSINFAVHSLMNVRLNFVLELIWHDLLAASIPKSYSLNTSIHLLFESARDMVW